MVQPKLSVASVLRQRAGVDGEDHEDVVLEQGRHDRALIFAEIKRPDHLHELTGRVAKPLQTDVVLAYARNHAAEWQVSWADRGSNVTEGPEDCRDPSQVDGGCDRQ